MNEKKSIKRILAGESVRDTLLRSEATGDGEKPVVGVFKLTKELSADRDDSIVLSPGTTVDVREDPTFRANKDVFFIYEIGKYPTLFTKAGKKWFLNISKKVN